MSIVGTNIQIFNFSITELWSQVKVLDNIYFMTSKSQRQHTYSDISFSSFGTSWAQQQQYCWLIVCDVRRRRVGCPSTVMF